MIFLLVTPKIHYVIDLDVLSKGIARELLNDIGYEILESYVDLKFIDENNSSMYEIFWEHKKYTFSSKEETRRFIKDNVYYNYEFTEKEIEKAVRKRGFYCKVYDLSNIKDISLLL